MALAEAPLASAHGDQPAVATKSEQPNTRPGTPRARRILTEQERSVGSERLGHGAYLTRKGHLAASRGNLDDGGCPPARIRQQDSTIGSNECALPCSGLDHAIEVTSLERRVPLLLLGSKLRFDRLG